MQQQEQTCNQLALVSFFMQRDIWSGCRDAEKGISCLPCYILCLLFLSFNQPKVVSYCFLHDLIPIGQPCLVFYEGFIGAINSCLRLSKTNAALPRKATSQQEEPTVQSINPPVFLCDLIFTVDALMPKGVFLVCCISSNELKGVCQNSTEVWDAIPVYSHMCQKYVWFLWVHSYMCMWPGSGVTIVIIV